jgi:hypothetical protein
MISIDFVRHPRPTARNLSSTNFSRDDHRRLTGTPGTHCVRTALPVCGGEGGETREDLRVRGLPGLGSLKTGFTHTPLPFTCPRRSASFCPPPRALHTGGVSVWYKERVRARGGGGAKEYRPVLLGLPRPQTTTTTASVPHSPRAPRRQVPVDPVRTALPPRGVPVHRRFAALFVPHAQTPRFELRLA